MMSLSTIGLRTMVAFSARKLLQNRRWMLVALLGALAVTVMGYAATQDGAGLYAGSDLMLLLLTAFLLPVLALLYGASMVRSEIDDRSIVQVITSPLDRRVSYVGYYIALVLVVCVLIAGITFFGGMSYLAFSPQRQGGLELLLGYMVMHCLGALAYSALFLLLGTVLRQPLYLGLFYMFVWEGFVAQVPGAIGSYTIRHQLQVAGSALIGEGSVANMPGGCGGIPLVLLAFSAIMVALGALVFRRMEVP